MPIGSRAILLVSVGAILVPLFVVGFIVREPNRGSQLTSAAAFKGESGTYLRPQNSPELYPLRDWNHGPIEIKASAALVIEMPSAKILYSKDIFEPFPIASISKLITALVTVEYLPMDKEIIITENAVATPENTAHLRVGERFTVEELLYALLLESSNDAAAAIAQEYNKTFGDGTFASLMNSTAQGLNLTTAHFAEPTGLSHQNVASVYDVASILYAVSKSEVLAEIINTPRYFVRRESLLTHEWINSNNLLKRADVSGGKTGFTEEAGESMVILAESPNGTKIITVVLNAINREIESEKLLDWLKEAYIWQ